MAASLLKEIRGEGGDGDDRDVTLFDEGDDDTSAAAEPTEPDGTALAPLVMERAIQLRRQRRQRRQRRLVVANAAPEMAGPDAAMIRAVVRARSWFAMLRERKVDSIADLGRREDVARAIVSHHLPLAFLAPHITEAVEGRQPAGLTLDRLLAIVAASPGWDRQRALFKAG